jgi:hypothetical protein
MSHWRIFYNIGNCYFKLNQPLQAKIFYLKAERLKPFDSSILKNLEIVNQHFPSDLPDKKMDFLERSFRKLEYLVPLNMISYLLIITLFGLNGLLLAWLWYGRRKILTYGIVIFFLLTVLFAGYHLLRVNEDKDYKTAVVVGNDVGLRSGPGKENTILFKVHPGLEVHIVEKSRRWYQVSAPSQIAGWIKSEDLIII